MVGIEYLYFDLGGVFFHWQGGLERLAEDSGHSLDRVREVFGRHDSLAVRGEISPQELWSRYCQELGMKEKERIDFLTYWTNCFVPISETHQLVYELIKRECPVGLVTNIYDGTLNMALKNGSVPRLPYRDIVQSCKLGLAKPGEAIFKYALEVAGVDAERILVVDDTEENILAVKKLGFQTYLFDTRNPQQSVTKIREMLNP